MRHQAGYVYQANGAFHVRYYTGTLKDGRPQRVQRSRRLCSISDGVRQARRLASDVMRTVNAGETHDMLVSDFWTQVYKPHIETSCKASTLSAYFQIWNGYLAVELTGVVLNDYTTAQATRFLTTLASRLGTRSVTHIRSLGVSVFKHAQRLGYIQTNPFRDAGSLVRPRPSNPTHAYTLDETEDIVNALRGDTRAQAVFMLSAFLGLRPGEIAGLKWDDIGDASLHIRRSSWRGLVGVPKTAESVASLPLIEPLVSTLSVWKQEQDSTWLFPGQGRPLDVSAYAKRHIKPLVEKAGLAWHGLYAGRRGAATNLVQLTGNAVAARAVLRHRSMQTTLTHYVLPDRSEAERGLRLLEAKLEERKSEDKKQEGE